MPLLSSLHLMTKLINKVVTTFQDVAGKIAAFATQSPRAVCVLSAMGSVSRVVLRHPADHASSVSRAPPSYNNPAIYEVGHSYMHGQIQKCT